MIRYRPLFLSALLFLGLCGPAFAAAPEYTTNSASLSTEKRGLYVSVRSLLDHWSGEHSSLEKASRLIEDFIRSEPSFLPIYIEKARHMIMLGYSENRYKEASTEALELIEQIQKKDPAYAKAYVLAGHALTNAGEFEKARKSLLKGLELDPNDPWVFINLATYYATVGRYELVYAHAEKGLYLSKENPKALVAAIQQMDRYVGYRPQNSGKHDIPSLVFERFDNPLERVHIAGSLIDSYSGNPALLQNARDILMRQKQETPELPAADLQLVRLIMKMSHVFNEGAIWIYRLEAASMADEVLKGLGQIDEFREDVFKYRMQLAVGTWQHDKALEILQEAESSGEISAEVLTFQQAYLAYAQHRYVEAIEIMETAGMRNSRLLAEAYDAIGDPTMLAEYYRNRIERSPNVAWHHGNYSAFLLREGKVDESIYHGERAVSLMRYPAAVGGLAAAYLLRSAFRWEVGDQSGAKDDFTAARELAKDASIELLIHDHCYWFCSQITETIRRFSNRASLGATITE